MDLRNNFVAAAADVEAIDVIAADHGRDVLADLTEIQSERGHLVAVDEEFGFRLVDLGVDDRRESEHATLGRFLLQRAYDLEDLLRLGRRGDDEFDREVAAARQRGRGHRTDADAGNPVQFGGESGQDLVRRALAFAPRFEAHAAEAGGRLGQLEGKVGLGLAEENVVGRFGITRGFFHRGIGRRIDDAENNSLVFGGGQLGRRHTEHRDAEQGDDRPYEISRRSCGQDGV